jgi:hypothetical protein
LDQYPGVPPKFSYKFLVKRMRSSFPNLEIETHPTWDYELQKLHPKHWMALPLSHSPQPAHGKRHQNLSKTNDLPIPPNTT